MVPGESKNNAYAKFGAANKEYYGISQSGLLNDSKISQATRRSQEKERCMSPIGTRRFSIHVN